MYILSIFARTIRLLHGRFRALYIMLQFFFLASAVLQIAGVASIAPFIAVLSNPDLIRENEILSDAFGFVGATNDAEFITVAGLGSAVLIVVANVLAATSQWLLLKFSVHFGRHLQTELFSEYLAKPFLFHKSVNYTSLISNVMHEVPRFVYMVFQPFLIFTSQLFIAAIVLTGLVLIDFRIAITAGGIVGGAYLATYVFLKRSLKRHGDVVTARNRMTQSITSESFIGVKEIKLAARESTYIEKFDNINLSGLTSLAFIALAGDVPRYVVESISLCALIGLSLWLLQDSTPGEVFPALSVFALAGYKLLPTLQQIYKSITSISANGDTASLIQEEIGQKLASHSSDTSRFDSSRSSLEQVSVIEARGLVMHYTGKTSPAVDGVSASFSIGKVNTIAGPSGSGKSTFVDLIIGLLTPAEGQLLINGEILDSVQFGAYQRTIGYVPQSIFILDDTLLANVALGESPREVDQEKVMEALRLANALDILDALPAGLQSQLGQDGRSLSGGQRQRIGIARALYRDCKMLVMDEPSAALDVESEKSLMSVMSQLKHQALIIMISHRPAAIAGSDIITYIEDGRLQGQFPVTEFLEKYPDYATDVAV